MKKKSQLVKIVITKCYASKHKGYKFKIEKVRQLNVIFLGANLIHCAHWCNDDRNFFTSFNSTTHMLYIMQKYKHLSNKLSTLTILGTNLRDLITRHATG